MRAMVMGWAAVLLAGLLSSGCFETPTPEARSAGHVPCTEDEISISNESSGDESDSWIATCHGKQYVCATHSGGFVPLDNRGAYAQLHETSCAPRDEDVAEAPSTAEKSASIPPQWIEHDGVRFQLPGDWARDFEAKGEVYRDDKRQYAARLVVEDFAGTDLEWAEKHYPGANQDEQTIGGRKVMVLRVEGSTLLVHAAVLVEKGKAIDLACSSTHKETSIPKACGKILNSLRLESD